MSHYIGTQFALERPASLKANSNLIISISVWHISFNDFYVIEILYRIMTQFPLYQYCDFVRGPLKLWYYTVFRERRDTWLLLVNDETLMTSHDQVPSLGFSSTPKAVRFFVHLLSDKISSFDIFTSSPRHFSLYSAYTESIDCLSSHTQTAMTNNKLSSKDNRVSERWVRAVISLRTHQSIALFWCVRSDFTARIIQFEKEQIVQLCDVPFRY